MLSQAEYTSGGYIYERSYSFDNEKRQNFHGSIYLENEFVPGEIKDIAKGTSQPAFLRYNLLEDFIEVKLTKDSEIRILPKDHNLVYDFGSYSMVLEKLEEKTGDISYVMKYYENGDMEFFAKPVLTAEKLNSRQYPDGNIKIYPDLKFFISQDNNLSEIDLRTKDVRKMFAENGAIQDYLKRNRINSVEKMQGFLAFYERNKN